jgi:hypothetical protein
LATPLGKEENQGTSTPLSIMSGGNKIPKPADISTDNIIKPSFDELSEEHRQAYEAYKKKRDEEDMNRYLANFNKDRLGNITAVGDITFPPLQSKEQVEIPVRPFTPEQTAVLNYHITEGNKLVCQYFSEIINAKNNTPISSIGHVGTSASVENPNTTEPINSSATETPIKQPQFGMPMNFFPGQKTRPGGELMVVPTYPEPIMSLPPFGASATNTSIPRSLPLPMPQLQTATVTSSPVVPSPPPYVASANMEEALAKMKDDLHKMFVESFGIERRLEDVHIKSHTHPILMLLLILKAIMFLNFLNLMVRIPKLHGSTLVNILHN